MDGGKLTFETIIHAFVRSWKGKTNIYLFSITKEGSHWRRRKAYTFRWAHFNPKICVISLVCWSLIHLWRCISLLQNSFLKHITAIYWWYIFCGCVVYNICDVWLLDCEIDYMDLTPAGTESYSPSELLQRLNPSHTSPLKAIRVSTKIMHNTPLIQRHIQIQSYIQVCWKP